MDQQIKHQYREGQEIDIWVWLNPGASDVREWVTATIVKVGVDHPAHYPLNQEPGCYLTLRYPDGDIRGPSWWSQDNLREPVW
jgi:hypothetical protein